MTDIDEDQCKVFDCDTWSLDGKYLIKAYARFRSLSCSPAKQTATAAVQVFEGDPTITRRSEIFFSVSNLLSNDLLDELQNAECIARDFIEAIQYR